MYLHRRAKRCGTFYEGRSPTTGQLACSGLRCARAKATGPLSQSAPDRAVPVGLDQFRDFGGSKEGFRKQRIEYTYSFFLKLSYNFSYTNGLFLRYDKKHRVAVEIIFLITMALSRR